MFEVAPQLLQDAIVLGDFPLCRLLLCKDSNYPWFILVPRREEVREIFQLSEDDQKQLIWESSYLSSQLDHGFNADKMNVAALGNQVPQLHLHHIVRYENDLAWPGPVWGKVPAMPYTESELANMKDRVNMLLTEQFRPKP
ncbi:MAG: HIT domain-containing protein [Pseudomonadales bacterium]|nr:HIT domain-containing protein [Pseudomonadales bacterium]